MKLTIFNGSPRGQKSNTRILLDQFIKGYEETPGNTAEIFYLNHVKDQEAFRQAYAAAETVILAFPLYTDAMPGVVKAFIDETLSYFVGSSAHPTIGFIVQSGFPEAEHSRHIQKYLEKLARRLDCLCLGTVVRGGVEGIQVQPPSMTNKLFVQFFQLGRVFGVTGQFDTQILSQLAVPERQSKANLLFYRLLSLTGLTNYYWDMQLKQNNVYQNRFAQPYIQPK